MSDYNSISIKDAMSNIATNYYLLPAIQRKFVWEIDQIEMLFDSVIRGYPINSFMLWKINDKKIKNNFKFYQFIKNFVQKFGEENPDAPVELLNKDFYAVVDGQQRLTSLYIGLAGSYKVKKPNKWWMENEQRTQMIKKELYLEITSELELSIDNEKKYNFKFLSIEEFEKECTNNPKCVWFKVSEVLKFEKLSDVNGYLRKNKLLDNDFSMESLTELYNKFNEQKLINYYCVDIQDQDKVLDIFIRTNSGGTPLSFSDLLMSISSANWKKFDAREEMREIRETIYSYGTPNFNVSQDFILKSLLVLSDVDVRFKIENFGRDNITLFEAKWVKIKSSLIATFKLLEKMNFNDTLLRAKNAAIPLAYYIYKKDLATKIVKTKYNKEDIKAISKWLNMSLLKGIFGGTSDNILKDLRDIISESTSQIFPLNEIVNKFKSNPDKNYDFNDEILKSIINEQYGSATCGIVLNLLYPDVVLQHGKSVAEDHMHPRITFENNKNLLNLKLTENQLEFYKNKENYNSCLNLQLLETTENEHKGDAPLSQWAASSKKSKDELYVKKSTSLDIKDFEKFIRDRKKMIMRELKSILII